MDFDRRQVLAMGGAAAGALAMSKAAGAVESPARAPVIDIHTHNYTTGWVDRVRANPDNSIRIVQGNKYEEIDYRGARITRLSPEMTDFDLRIQNMDAAGVDMAVISLTAPNVFVESKELSVQLARQVNEDFAAEQARYPDRLRWMASLPWEHPVEAITEIEHAKSIGASGICTLTNILGAKLTDPKFETIWSAIEKSGLPTFVHPTTPFVDGMGLSQYGLANTIGFTTDTSLCFAHMFLDGFIDRHPDLKLIACHGGGALPYLIARFDQMWHKSSGPRRSMEEPSAYLPRIWYDSIVYDEATLRFLIEQVGTDRVLYGSDYPFLIGDMVGVKERVKRLPESQQSAILGGNAAELYGFDIG